jgi:serine/threonine-protein kinase
LGYNFDFLKVLDFGLVKFALDSATTQLTAQGIATGTPAYMAPECGADSRKIDARSDIYSLGCVAYWLLTGKLVFDEEGAYATVLAHMNKAPAPPSQRTEREVPPGLEAVTMQCLEKEPGRRPQSALELDRLLSKTDAGEPWTRDQARRWWEANLPQFCHPPSA